MQMAKDDRQLNFRLEVQNIEQVTISNIWELIDTYIYFASLNVTE